MRLTIEAVVSRRKNGTVASAKRINLAAHGDTEDSAIRSLRSAVTAWAASLERGGDLAGATRRAGVSLSDTPGPVEVVVIPRTE